MIKPWPVQRSEPVADCRIFKVRKDVVTNPRNGSAHEMYVIENADWVNVIPLTADDHVVMIEQWRHGSRSVELETPGGLMEHGETVDAAGRRELLEETGYAADQIVHLGTTFPNPAIQSNRQHYVLAKNCRKAADLKLDHAEDIVVRLILRTEVPQLIQTGKIRHGIVIAGLLWLEMQTRG